MKKKTDMTIAHELFEKFPTLEKTIKKHNPIATYKTVLLPIKLPVEDYCWDQETSCDYFDNEGGHPTCDLKLGYLEYDEKGCCPKPNKCLTLRKVTFLQ